MSNVAITVDPRMRALSFVAATGVIALLCFLMLVVSQVARYNDATNNSVRIFMEEAPRTAPPPARASPPPRGGVSVLSPDAPPTPTALPVDTEMLTRALACFERLNRDRPADCPQEALEEAPGDRARTRRAYDISPERAAPPTYTMGVDPPCQRGVSTVMLPGDTPGIQYCGGWGVTPPPPSRSAEQVCVEGGVGPCHPPPFRPEDVQRLGHTQ